MSHPGGGFDSRSIGQVGEAMQMAMLPPEAYKPWPWPSVAQIMGGVAPGKLWYVCMYSGIGKTTLLTSLCDAVLARGDRVYAVPTESTAKDWIQHLTCRKLGLHPGWLATGIYQKGPDWPQIRQRLIDTYVTMAENRTAWGNLYVSDIPDFSQANVELAFDQAQDFKADWILWDHVDHLAQDGRMSEWQVSFQGNKTLREETKYSGIRTIASSQLKDEIAKTNRLALHMVPSEAMVKFGGHKRELCDGMIGGCWPLRLDGVSEADVKAYRDRLKSAKEVCEPNTLCLGMMKHRDLGEMVGERVFLRVERGKVEDIGQEIYRAAMDGVRANFDTKASYQSGQSRGYAQ